MGAAACAVGSAICFGAERYSPETIEGEALLGHELVHVVQQSRGAARTAAAHEEASAEREAREITAGLWAGGPIDVAVAAPPAPAAAEESWWDSFRGTLSTAANTTSAATNAAMIGGDAANAARLGAGGFTGWLGGLPGVNQMGSLGRVGMASGDAVALTSLGKGLSTASNVASGVGVGLGLYNLATATNRSDQVQAGADTLASGAGLLGPVGSAFSAGYSGGQVLDNALGISDATSDMMLDTLGPGPGLWLAEHLGL